MRPELLDIIRSGPGGVDQVRELLLSIGETLNLSGANLRSANLSGANLSGATMTCIQLGCPNSLPSGYICELDTDCGSNKYRIVPE